MTNKKEPNLLLVSPQLFKKLTERPYELTADVHVSNDRAYLLSPEKFRIHWEFKGELALTKERLKALELSTVMRDYT